jgi:hypothetical protein
MSEEKKPRKGYQTSEFWLSLAATLFGALFASGVVSEGGKFEMVLGLVASTLTALGYTVSRTKAKAIEAPKA